MDRRTAIKWLLASSVASSMMSMTPIAWAQEDKKSTADHKNLLTIYGPIVLPTLLLGVAAQQGKLKDIQPWRADVWRDVDVLRAGLANHSMDLSIVPSYVAANLAARGEKVKLINIMTRGLLQFISRDGAITSVADLVGKKIVLPFKNDMPDLILQALCQKAGIQFSDLSITYTATPPEALALFLHQKADLALLPEPLVSVAIMRGKMSGQNIERVFDIQKAWEQATHTSAGIPQAGLLVSEAFYIENQAFLHQLDEDLKAALAWTQANPKQASEIGATLIPAPALAIEAALPHANLVIDSTRAIESDMMTFFQALYELNPKIVGGKLPDSSLFA